MAQSIRVAIVGDASSYQRALGKAETSTATFGSTVAKTLGRAAAFTGLTIGAAELVKFGVEAVRQAAQVQKFEEAVRANFGAASKTVLEFADTAPKLGLVDDAALQTAANFGILFKNLGIGKAQAAEMTVGWEKLGVAIAAIKGQDPASVISKLTLAAAGNTRGLKQMGIAIDTASIKQEALRLGILRTGEALTPTIKAQAIYSLATKNLGEFQAQAAAHSDDFINKQRVLTAEWDQAREQLGKALLPAMTELVTVLANNLPSAMAFASSVVQAFIPVLNIWKDMMIVMVTPMRVIIDLLRGDWTAAWTDAKAPVIAIWNTIQEIFGSIASKITSYISGAAAAAHNFGAGILSGMKAGILGFVDWIDTRISAGVQAVRDRIASAIAAATALGTGIVRGVTSGLASLTADVTDKFKALWGVLQRLGPLAFSFASGIGQAIVQGIWAGIQSLAGWLWDKITSWVGGLLNAALGALGISSPSRVFAERVGKPMAQGIAVGFGEGMKVTQKMIGQSLSIGSVPQPAGLAGGFSIAGAGGGTVNITVNMPNYLGDTRTAAQEIRRELQRIGRDNAINPLAI